MAAPSVTFDGLNINDGTTYTIYGDVFLGEPVKTFSEYRSYSGTVKQYDVSTANLIQMSIPLRVVGSSVSDLKTNIAALNTKIAGCSSATPKTLAFDSVNYSVVSSPEVAPTLSQLYQNRYICFVDLVLYRTP